MIFKSKIKNIIFWLFVITGFLYGCLSLYSKFNWETLSSLHQPSLLISIAFSAFGFLFQSISWWLSIKEVGGHNYNLSTAISDHGITIFASINNLILSISIGFCCSIIVFLILDEDIWILIQKFEELLPYMVAAAIVLVAFILYYYFYYIKKSLVSQRLIE